MRFCNKTHKTSFSNAIYHMISNLLDFKKINIARNFCNVNQFVSYLKKIAIEILQ